MKPDETKNTTGSSYYFYYYYLCIAIRRPDLAVQCTQLHATKFVEIGKRKQALPIGGAFLSLLKNIIMGYRWKPNASQRKAFAEKMKDPAEEAAYNERKKAKRIYENWKDNEFIPTKDQYDYCMENIFKTTGNQLDAFNSVITGFVLNEKIAHEHIHIVNQLRRGETEFNNF